MEYNITPGNISNKNVDELSVEEMSFVHLYTNYSPISVKNAALRSTLSFIHQNIQHSLNFDYSKQLMPYLSLCAVLDQLGICYNRKDKEEPRFANGIKRCLVYFGEIEEDDEIIDTLYALRNGLLHNVSLTSKGQYNDKHYIFRYNNEIEGVYQKAEKEWDGIYETLDRNRELYTTYINVEKFRDLVYTCIRKAEDLNQDSMLELRLPGGARQLFYDYIRSLPI
ncbi:MAG: hypothetical protein K0S09_1890 [Sphingobacteriaceae bacterium]|nr:hypothetical protein [Sphingobacteriaceae bacterium]